LKKLFCKNVIHFCCVIMDPGQKKVGFGFSLQKKSSRKKKRKIFGDHYGRVLAPVEESPPRDNEPTQFKPVSSNLVSVIDEHSRKTGPRVVPLPKDKVIVHSDHEEDNEGKSKTTGKPPILKNGLNLLKRPRGVAVGDPDSSSSFPKRFKGNDGVLQKGKSEDTVVQTEDVKITIKNNHTQEDVSLERAAVNEILREVQEAEKSKKDEENQKREIKMNLTRQRVLSKRMIELDAKDLDSDTSFRQYNRSPIDGFGAAMLRGMGWREGSKIGGTNKANVKPYIAHKRARRQGLGAAPVEKKRNRKWIPKPGDEKKSLPVVTSKPKVVKCTEESVPISRKVIKKQLSWVHENLRVRIVTEDFGTKYFRKKGLIIAVESCWYFAMRMDDGKRKVLRNVVEADVETYVPRVGNRVEILNGEYKGYRGIIREKRKEKGIAFVQVDDELEIVKLPFDDICSFE